MKVTITKITTHKRFKQRYHLYLDKGQGEEYGFSVDEDVLIKRGIKKGLELDEEELLRIIDEDERKKTYHLSIHYLSYRMRSVWELRQYLQEKERKVEHIEAAIEELLKQKLLNDVEFAKSFVRTKKNTQLKGPIKIAQELKQKGVSIQNVEVALLEYSLDEEIDKLQQWLQKQKPSERESVAIFRQKQQQKLQLKGFQQSAITQAYSGIELEEQDGQEWLALQYQAEKMKKKYLMKYNTFEYEQKIKQGLFRKGFAIEDINRWLEKEKELDVD
ncbi:recombination regulator RecX [Alkalihalobacillus pseudalcaliphilus]|uniref:recombination regulator RecX n=1 Tax=Alkalihalobacillus pseudalcaliphilus TaxID=79884 RepID=UPI00064E06FB|nr:recombination regulator RecX [Alkalihalobacillus pseudalcaliphilus]KMK74948.1 recombinase RecX [Alkalihalobacillus pseudalcaliphilus]